MPDTETLEVDLRSIKKKKVGRLRREGIIPAVIYGKTTSSTPIQVGYKDFEAVYKKIGGTSILNLRIKGEDRQRDTLIHTIQRHILSQKILHIDFLEVDVGKPVTVEVPIVFKGKSPVEEAGKGRIGQEATYIYVKALPMNIPSEIEVDVSIIENTDQVIHGSDLKLPEGVTLASDSEKDTVIATVVLPRVAEEVEIEEKEEEEVEEAEEAEEETPEE
ncbi:MAG: 50S ribosomal protein L25 [Deltaproteobacteria bacterium]|nr:50S ribosomal protein L25 [Deltaproteobacteria bacterium]